MDQKQSWSLENGFLISKNNVTINQEWWYQSNAILLLFICYAVVIFGGIFGNAALVCSIISQPSGRLRKPLLFALCLADLLVVCVSAPLTIVILSFTNTWPLQSIGCKAVHYLRLMPVAASTICLLMLSLDRYATVKHPRLGQLNQRRYLPLLLAIVGWMGACLICTHIFFAYEAVTVDRDDVAAIIMNSKQSVSRQQVHFTKPYHSNHQQQITSASAKAHIVCKADYGSPEAHKTISILHALLVFIIPAIGTLINHLGVRQKLCALSLCARAAHGELPLPMPILRRPTHMIIVTGIANAAGVDSSEDECGGDLLAVRGTREKGVVARLKKTPRTPRALTRSQNQTNSRNKPSSDLPLPQTSTLRSRRRLANILVVSAIIFLCFWSPHVFCFLCLELGAAHVCTKSMSEFSFLLGLAHSAITPILYWTLNHNSLKQSCCSPCTGRLTSAQNVLRSHLRFRTPPPPPSSTNEAALGPFNPRYTKARHHNSYRPPPASSHYLY